MLSRRSLDEVLVNAGLPHNLNAPRQLYLLISTIISHIGHAGRVFALQVDATVVTEYLMG